MNRDIAKPSDHTVAYFERRIDIDAPVAETYCQWSRPEEFPHFMKSVRNVRPLADGTLEWRGAIGGRSLGWTAVITQQETDRRIAWRSIEGARHHGAVEFEPIEADRTRVALEFEYQPAGILEAAASALGVVAVLIDGELRRFKRFMETRHRACARRASRTRDLEQLREFIATSTGK